MILLTQPNSVDSEQPNVVGATSRFDVVVPVAFVDVAEFGVDGVVVVGGVVRVVVDERLRSC